MTSPPVPTVSGDALRVETATPNRKLPERSSPFGPTKPDG